MKYHDSMKLVLKAAIAAGALFGGAALASPDPIISLEVEYKRSDSKPSNLDGLSATPGKYATSLRKGVPGSFSDTRANRYLAACTLKEGNGQGPEEETRELSAGLSFEATVRSITPTTAVMDIRTGVVDLRELKPIQSEVCAISAPVTVGANYEGRIALPLDGSPFELPLRDGEVLVLRVAKSWSGPI
ncbi:MAG: hypothetical protein E2591_27385 [Achromobacter sp.]|uniref:hypothetical protein n=1 Tax=Achromobacter sp. TaxID=134375 RepID=UPI0012D10425|nr:hypothetical protein [Achromobacter sp.]MPS81795.1 hypothetical protein [Achromobacter sp.]